MYARNLAAFVVAPLLFLCFGSGASIAQQPQAGLSRLRPVDQTDRVLPGASSTQRAQLSAHLPKWVNTQTLLTDKVDTLQTLHLNIVLRRSTEAQAAFEQLLRDQQNPSSDLYHQWLTPAQVGSLFGPTQHDVNAVSSWLAGAAFVSTRLHRAE